MLPNRAYSVCQQFEGCARKGRGGAIFPYRDPVGIATIGFGTTLYPNGRRVKMSDRPIDLHQAQKLMRRDMGKFERGVRSSTRKDLHPLMYGALTVFAYNLGLGAYKSSTLRRKVNSGDYTGASKEFGRWVYAGKGKNRRRLRGLIRRRKAEMQMFVDGVSAMGSGDIDEPSQVAKPEIVTGFKWLVRLVFGWFR